MKEIAAKKWRACRGEDVRLQQLAAEAFHLGACRLLHVSRPSLKYQSRMPERDRAPLKVLIDLAAQFPRWGYRRMRVMLERKGFKMNEKRAYRLWRLAELRVPKKKRRRRVAPARLRPRPRVAAYRRHCEYPIRPSNRSVEQTGERAGRAAGIALG
jgi:hypothetical protein